MIETIGKALYDMVAWVGCLTTGESWEEVKNEERLIKNYRYR